MFWNWFFFIELGIFCRSVENEYFFLKFILCFNFVFFVFVWVSNWDKEMGGAGWRIWCGLKVSEVDIMGNLRKFIFLLFFLLLEV